MKKEQIMDFTRRISQSNRGGLVIVIYDIFFAYMEDTKEAHDNGEWENYKTALRNASKTISELISSLDFSYELAGELYRIYVFCRETLAKAMYKRDLKEVELAENLMKKLYTAFAEVMKEDTSAPLMRNTQQIYAGYTYGKNDLFVPFPYRFVDHIEMTVYNRWGNKVFETTDKDIKWKGTKDNGSVRLSDGVYYYVCTVYEIYIDGIKARTIHGAVQLIGGK